MTLQELAGKIDHTILKPEATRLDIGGTTQEGLEYGFAAVCVAGVFVKQVALLLGSSRVRTCAVVGFPQGTSSTPAKAFEAVMAVKDGAAEIDVVAHLPNLLEHHGDAVYAELAEIVKAARSARSDVVVKVIIESALLLSLGPDRGEGAIATACQAIRQSGGDFVKTSTGFHPAGGASIEAVKLMKKHGQGLKIKASGGIRDLKTARAMLDAGADRLGLSASVAILKELEAKP